MLSANLKKKLVSLSIIIIIILFLWLIYKLFFTSNPKPIIRENYENIILKVTSGCLPGSVFNDKTNSCSVPNDIVESTTQPDTIILLDNNNTILLELISINSSDDFYLDDAKYNINSKITNFSDLVKAIPHVDIINGRKKTNIFVSNISTLFNPPQGSTKTFEQNLQDFISSAKVQQILKTMIGKNTNFKLSPQIMEDINTQISIEFKTITLESGITAKTQNLVIKSKWMSPNYQDSNCTFSNGAWSAVRTFNLSPPLNPGERSIPNIYQLNTNSITLNNPYPTSVSISCDQPQDCLLTYESTEGSYTKSTTNPNTYTFTIKFNFNINQLENLSGTECKDPSLYTNYNYITGDDIKVDSTNLKSTLTKTTTITYSNTSEIDTKISSPGLQLLVKQAENFNTINNANFINSYAYLFDDFYGDISRLPILILTAADNEVFSRTEGGDVVTNIIGRKTSNVTLDLNPNSETFNNIKTMVENMTNIKSVDISSLAIFNTFNITLLLTPTGGIQQTYKMSADSNGNNLKFRRTLDNQNEALFSFIRNGTTNVGYLQHIISGKIIEAPSPTPIAGIINSLGSNFSAKANIETSIFNLDINNSTGILRLQNYNLFLTGSNFNPSSPQETLDVIWSTSSTQQVTSFPATYSSAATNIIDTIINKNSWVNLPLLGTETPNDIAVRGDSRAIYSYKVNNQLPTSGTNLVLYNGIDNLNVIPTPISLPGGGVLYNIYWDNNSNTISGVGENFNCFYNNDPSISNWIEVTNIPKRNVNNVLQSDVNQQNPLFQYVRPFGTERGFTIKNNLDLVTGEFDGIANNVLYFSSWGNPVQYTQGSNIIQYRILLSINTNDNNNLRIVEFNQQTLINKNASLGTQSPLPSKVITCPFNASIVALNVATSNQTQAALVVEKSPDINKNGRLYYTPNILKSDNNPIWMLVNTPEPVARVSFRQNYAAIISASTTPKIYVCNTFEF